MKIKKEIRRNRKINVSEKAKLSKDNKIALWTTGLSGNFLSKMEMQLW